MSDFIRNLRETDLGIEGEVYFKLFDQYIILHNFDHATPAYMQKCAEALNSLSEELVDDLCRASLRYRTDFLDAVGDRAKKIQNPRGVLKIIRPIGMSVPSEDNLDVPVVDLELACEWEEEHGMGWLVREGKILFVGAACGEIHGAMRTRRLIGISPNNPAELFDQ